MSDLPPKSLIDLEASVREELEKRLVAQTGTVDLDKLADSVRIEAPARAQAQAREMLQQPWLCD